MISEKQQNWKNIMMNEWLNNRIEREREREREKISHHHCHSFSIFFLFIDNRKNSTFLLSNMCRHHHQVFLLFVCPIYPFIIIIITNENFASSFILFFCPTTINRMCVWMIKWQIRYCIACTTRVHHHHHFFPVCKTTQKKSSFITAKKNLQ